MEAAGFRLARQNTAPVAEGTAGAGAGAPTTFMRTNLPGARANASANAVNMGSPVRAPMRRLNLGARGAAGAAGVGLGFNALAQPSPANRLAAANVVNVVPVGNFAVNHKELPKEMRGLQTPVNPTKNPFGKLGELPFGMEPPRLKRGVSRRSARRVATCKSRRAASRSRRAGRK